MFVCLPTADPIVKKENIAEALSTEEDIPVSKAYAHKQTNIIIALIKINILFQVKKDKKKFKIK